MLSAFRKVHPEAHLEIADARSFEPIDLIYSSQLLQYMRLADIDRQLNSLRKSLKPGGLMLHT
jgi:trans-aconitate methyltransferase